MGEILGEQMCSQMLPGLRPVLSGNHPMSFNPGDEPVQQDERETQEFIAVCLSKFNLGEIVFFS